MNNKNTKNQNPKQTNQPHKCGRQFANMATDSLFYIQALRYFLPTLTPGLAVFLALAIGTVTNVTLAEALKRLGIGTRSLTAVWNL